MKQKIKEMLEEASEDFKGYEDDDEVQYAYLESRVDTLLEVLKMMEEYE